MSISGCFNSQTLGTLKLVGTEERKSLSMCLDGRGHSLRRIIYDWNEMFRSVNDSWEPPHARIREDNERKK